MGKFTIPTRNKVVPRYFAIPISCLALLLAATNIAPAATDAEIKSAIQRGQGFLLSKLSGLKDGERSFVAYALLKTDINKSDARIQEAVAAAVQAATKHFSPGMPRYGNEFAYTVPCHMFLLEAADPAAYKDSLEKMAGYLIEHQQANGSWFYTVIPSNVSDAGDTSMTQFALLGLWAAYRAGVEVPVEPLQKAAQWLIQTQRDDGGFVYHPFVGAQASAQGVRYSITFSGVSSLLVVRRIFYPDSTFGDDIATMTKPKPKSKSSVLKRLDDVPQQARRQITIPPATFDRAISRGLKNIGSRFTSAPVPNWKTYLLYAMERSAALLDTETFGEYDWYAYASDELVRLQTADGSWSDNAAPAPATSFAILCLSRATAQALGKPRKTLGGGLLAGARGLPDDLARLNLKDGQAVERKSKGAVDDLLADLEKVQDVSVAEVQQAILESVNLDDRDQLVGQVARLKRLAGDPRAEVRRTALWAIGRSGEIKLAPLLIAGLSDVDVDVIREASYGLTVLSRKPTGIIDAKEKLISVEPLEGVAEDATPEDRQKHLDAWLADALPAWKKWYFSVRPYDERDDRQTLQKKR
jgi:hypothetical protein